MRTGIWIPVWIENLKLTNSQKKLLAEIVSLHLKGRCFASNKYFSEVLDLKPDTISGMISALKKKGFIRQTGFDGRKRFLEPTTASDFSPRQDREEGHEIISATGTYSVSDSDSKPGPCTLIIEDKNKSTIELKTFQEKIKGFSKDTKLKLLQIFETGEGDLKVFDQRILKIWNQITTNRQNCIG